MKGFTTNIEQAALASTHFRQVLYTGKHTQIVLMSITPGDEIGEEVHPDNDQFFRFEAGRGKVVVDGNTYEVGDGHIVLVPAGANHNVINTSRTEPLQLVTLYSPPHHKDGTIHETKEEAEANDEEFDGVTTE